MSDTDITRGTEREIAEFLAEYYGVDDIGGDSMAKVKYTCEGETLWECESIPASMYASSDSEGMNGLTDRIRQWAIQRDLHKADPSKQALKLGEEFGELCEGLAKGDEDDVRDALGDMYVVMTIMAMQLGFSIEGCIAQAYDEIKDRKGVMRDGVFVKEGDLKTREGDKYGDK